MSDFRPLFERAAEARMVATVPDVDRASGTTAPHWRPVPHARLGFHLTAMEALGEIASVLSHQRDLSLHGFWCANHPDYRTRVPFDRDRRKMARPRQIEGFRWARHVLLIRSAGLFTPHHQENSFDLREIAEHAATAMLNKPLAIEEGSVIAAALSLGFSVDRAENGWSGQITLIPTRARP